MTTEFDELLNFDPLVEAEKITGKSYKDDEETARIGMILHVQKNKEIRDELSLRKDTYHRIPWNSALSIYAELGFEEIFSEEFKDGFWKEKPSTEYYKIFWRNGFLLTAESYNNHSIINSSKLYYNWAPNDYENSWKLTSSGHYSKNAAGEMIWAGNHDVREGLKNTMSNLEQNGTILSEWQYDVFLWLVNFSVAQGDYDYEAETARVVSQFPQSIQDMLNNVSPY